MYINKINEAIVDFWKGLASSSSNSLISKLVLLKNAVRHYKTYKEFFNTISIPIDERTNVYFPPIGHKTYPIDPDKKAQIISMSTLRQDRKCSPTLYVEEPITFEVEILVNEDIDQMNISFMIHDAWVKYLSATHSAMVKGFPTKWNKGKYKIQMVFPMGIINCGRFGIRVGLGWVDDTLYDYHNDGLGFEIISHDKIVPHSIHSHGLLCIIPQYSLIEGKK